jgi:flavin reductase (DIM6/NTAB) family NADH-FMN oxidoreductase RutF
MSPSPDEPDRYALLRGVSRQLTTGVCVLTAEHLGLVHGGTVSTATVVAQRPLSLAVSLRRESFLARLATESSQFACNVLSSRQAVIADWFANPDRPAGSRQFERVGWDPAPGTGIPLLRGALAHLLGRISWQRVIGDEVLLVAEITAGESGVGRPLVGFGGELHDVELHDVMRRQGWRAASAPVATLH